MLRRTWMLGVLLLAGCAGGDLLAPTAKGPPQTQGTPPSVDFSWSCDALTVRCAFVDDVSPGSAPISYIEYIPGGGDVGWHPTNPPDTVVHQYDHPGLYQVKLTAYALDGLQAEKIEGVYVPAVGDTFPFILRGYSYRVKGKRHVALGWANADDATVTLWQDGAVIAVDEENDGFYMDVPGRSGTYVYRVCDADECAPDLVLAVQ